MKNSHSSSSFETETFERNWKKRWDKTQKLLKQCWRVCITQPLLVFLNCLSSVYWSNLFSSLYPYQVRGCSVRGASIGNGRKHFASFQLCLILDWQDFYGEDFNERKQCRSAGQFLTTSKHVIKNQSMANYILPPFLFLKVHRTNWSSPSN